MLSSRDDLGINSTSEDRFSFRFLTECSPLAMDTHVKKNSSQGNVLYFYGKTNEESSKALFISGPITYAYQENVANTLGRVEHNSDYVLEYVITSKEEFAINVSVVVFGDVKDVGASHPSYSIIQMYSHPLQGEDAHPLTYGSPYAHLQIRDHPLSDQDVW